MVTKRIQLQGISRDKNADSFGDGECQEIINLRPRDGQWKIRKRAKKIYQNLAALYTNLWYHDQDGVGKWIGTLITGGKNVLCVVDTATGARTTIKEYLETENIRVVFLKRFLIAITDNYIDKFIYKEGSYSLFDFSNKPKLTFRSSQLAQTRTAEASNADALLGKFRSQLIELNEKWGNLDGAITFRVAFKLFDGTYALHSLPIYHKIAPLQINIQNIAGRNTWVLKYDMAFVSGVIDRSYYNSFAEMKDIISSVVIFASKNERIYQIDNSTITDENLNNYVGIDGFTVDVGYLANLNADFKSLADPVNWYKVHEISFKDACDITKTADLIIDWKGYYLNYAVKEILPVDSFSHHSISANNAMVYNDRLMLLGTKTTFGVYDNPLLPSKVGYIAPFIELRIFYLLVTINTNNGQAFAWNRISGNMLTSIADGKEYAVFSNKIIGYPDSRATEARLIVYEPFTGPSGTYYSCATITLTPSLHDNYAYYNNPEFTKSLYPDDELNHFGEIRIDITSKTQINNELFPSSPLTDENRFQASALRNPFIFPVQNSYQVGTGAIIAAGVNTEAMSSGQYGQFPLIIFTTKGIYALEQGSGDVLFTSISPLNADIARSDTQIVNISNGVLYVTDRGIFIVLGKEVIEISKLIEGQPDVGFLVNEHFNFFFTDPRLGAFTTGLNTELSTNDILQYITGAIIGYDKYNNEIIFSNNDYLMNYSLANRYSYVYDLDTASWHKTDDVYEMFVSNYPHLYGIKVSQAEKNGIYDLTQDGDDSNIKVLVVTQPQNFDEPGIYKKISRMVLRAMLKITPGTYFTVAVFGSDDLRTWQLLTGGQRSGTETPYQNMLLTRGHGSFTYYRIVLIGQLHPDSTITGIDLTTVPRLNRKLRP